MLLTHCLCDKNEVVNFINATFGDESVNIVIMILHYNVPRISLIDKTNYLPTIFVTFIGP